MTSSCTYEEKLFMQRGYIYRKSGSWYLRYRAEGKQRAVRLADVSDEYRTARSVRRLADVMLAPLNAGQITKDDAVAPSLAQFFDSVYLPHIAKQHRPSTAHGYKKLYKARIAAAAKEIDLVRCRTVDIQRFLDKLADDSGLSKQSLKNIRNLISGAFEYAIRNGYRDTNPVGSRSSASSAGRASPTQQRTYQEMPERTRPSVPDPV